MSEKVWRVKKDGGLVTYQGPCDYGAGHSWFSATYPSGGVFTRTMEDFEPATVEAVDEINDAMKKYGVTNLIAYHDAYNNEVRVKNLDRCPCGAVHPKIPQSDGKIINMMYPNSIGLENQLIEGLENLYMNDMEKYTSGGQSFIQSGGTLKSMKLDREATIPTKNHKTDAGYDLYAVGPESIMLTKGGGVERIKTGVAIAIPAGYVGLICDRSGLGSKGLKVHGGVVDHGYTGDVTVCMSFHGNEGSYAVNKGDKIAQIVVMPIFQGDVEEVDSLDNSERGDKGFGSSGV